MTESCSPPVGKLVGVVALVFASGVATGFLANMVLGDLSAEPGTEFRIQATLNDLSGELELNPSQMEQIREILDDAIMDEAELLSELKMNQIDARERIAQYLTPEQNQRFDRMLDISAESR